MKKNKVYWSLVEGIPTKTTTMGYKTLDALLEAVYGTSVGQTDEDLYEVADCECICENADDCDCDFDITEWAVNNNYIWIKEKKQWFYAKV